MFAFDLYIGPLDLSCSTSGLRHQQLQSGGYRVSKLPSFWDIFWGDKTLQIPNSTTFGGKLPRWPTHFFMVVLKISLFFSPKNLGETIHFDNLMFQVAGPTTSEKTHRFARMLRNCRGKTWSPVFISGRPQTRGIFFLIIFLRTPRLVG